MLVNLGDFGYQLLPGWELFRTKLMEISPSFHASLSLPYHFPTSLGSLHSQHVWSIYCVEVTTIRYHLHR